jgi:hypothetical protein
MGASDAYEEEDELVVSILVGGYRYLSEEEL